jgi:Flp pilus assembly pilin Flp
VREASDSVSYAKSWCCEQQLITDTTEIASGAHERRLAGYRVHPPSVTITFNEEWRDMKNLFVRFVREEDGQDLIEYAFLIIFIAFVAAAGANALGLGINTLFDGIGTQVSGLSAPGLPTPGAGGS